MKKEFWGDWKNKTKLEETAIKSIRKAKKILFDNISKDKIHSIYIKGSFVRREMNKRSDVDIMPITYDNKTLEKIKKLEDTKGYLYKPAELLPHSLKEFEQGKRHLKYKTLKGNIDITLRNLYRYKLIYGKKIDINSYPMRSDLEFLKNHIVAFRKFFLPLYKQGKFSFSNLVKQIFFLIEREERIKGKEPPETWKKLAKSIKDKKHIVHDVLDYRLHPGKEKKIREKIIKKLENYLSFLDKTKPIWANTT